MMSRQCSISRRQLLGFVLAGAAAAASVGSRAPDETQLLEFNAIEEAQARTGMEAWLLPLL
jgi:hypothetical protein